MVMRLRGEEERAKKMRKQPVRGKKKRGVVSQNPSRQGFKEEGMITCICTAYNKI